MSKDNVSLREGLELLADGEFDSKISRMPRRKGRRARRLKRRSGRKKTQEQLFDELIPAMQADQQCCRVVAALADDEFDEDTPLGFDADEFFAFLDGFLDRLPDIIDAILSLISLFGALLLVVALSSSASAQTVCVNGQCRTVPQWRAAKVVARTVARPLRTIRPVRVVTTAVVSPATFPPAASVVVTHSPAVSHAQAVAHPVPQVATTCVNGQCVRTRTTVRNGWYLGKNLGR